MSNPLKNVYVVRSQNFCFLATSINEAEAVLMEKSISAVDSAKVGQKLGSRTPLPLHVPLPDAHLRFAGLTLYEEEKP